MPWKEVRPMEERIHFISDYLRGKHSIRDLCNVYGISRKTGYKWINRFEFLGSEGLKDISRKPHNSPHRIPIRMQKELIDLRKRYGWGPKKLLTIMQKNHSGWELPARSTVCDILRREGLVKKRRLRRRVPAMPHRLASADHPNAVWTADYKGQFRTGNGKYCFPLTIADAYSRYLFDCRGLSGIKTEDTKKVFIRLFNEYGLPERIRTDNGVPFATTSASGLSRLAVWWIRLGICPERIDVGKPQQNGRHERMHRTLKAATAKPPAATMNAQQVSFDNFRKQYNEIRPHEALGFKTPASIYTPSLRRMPLKIPSVDYPGHYEIKYVNYNGCIYWRNEQVYVGYLLKEDYIGFNETDDGVWDVYYGPVLLGSFNEEAMKIRFGQRNFKKV